MLKLLFLLILVSSFGLSIPLDDEDEEDLYESIFTDGVHMVKNLYKNIFSWFGEDDQYDDDYYEGAETNVNKRNHYSSDQNHLREESSESDEYVDNLFANIFPERENRNLKRGKDARRPHQKKVYIVKKKTPPYDHNTKFSSDKQSYSAKPKYKNNKSDEDYDSNSSSDSSSGSNSGSNSDEDESNSASTESSRQRSNRESKEVNHKNNKGDENKLRSSKTQYVNRNNGRNDKYPQQSRYKKHVIGNHKDNHKKEKLIDFNNFNKFKDVKNRKKSQKNRGKSKSDEDEDNSENDDNEDESSSSSSSNEDEDEEEEEDEEEDDDDDDDDDDNEQDNSNSLEHKNKAAKKKTVKEFSKRSKNKHDINNCSNNNTSEQEMKIKKHVNRKGRKTSKDRNTKKSRKRKEKFMKGVSKQKRNTHKVRMNDNNKFLSRYLSPQS